MGKGGQDLSRLNLIKSFRTEFAVGNRPAPVQDHHLLIIMILIKTS
jgi:hypothetical protein